ncbi:hypothetical protein hamaS1_24530 [Moorella sp. Hama-1]|nr:hypothetical protein hamaS1_24530 [Moorella sp. Hama-1]
MFTSHIIFSSLIAQARTAPIRPGTLLLYTKCIYPDMAKTDALEAWVIAPTPLPEGLPVK